MNIDRWNCPFQGLGYFLTHPRIWGWAFLGTLLAGTATIAVCAKVIAATYPSYFSIWKVLQSFGWGLFALVLMVAIVFPIIFNACFAKAFSRELGQKEMGSFWASAISSLWVFTRTLKWRILWPLILLITIFFLPFLMFPISLFAANHLAVIECVDLVLTLFGKTGSERVDWINNHGTDCFAIALSGSLLAFLLSLIIIGWVLWIPALYCGVFIWITHQIQEIP